MNLQVTAKFKRQYTSLTKRFNTLDKQLQAGFEKLFESPQSVRFEPKKGNSGLFSMRLEDGNRVLLAPAGENTFLPVFIGNHHEYDQFLAENPNANVLTDKNQTNRAVIDIDVAIPVDNLNDFTEIGNIPRSSYNAHSAPDLAPKNSAVYTPSITDYQTLGFTDVSIKFFDEFPDGIDSADITDPAAKTLMDELILAREMITIAENDEELRENQMYFAGAYVMTEVNGHLDTIKQHIKAFHDANTPKEDLKQTHGQMTQRYSPEAYKKDQETSGSPSTDNGPQ